jgi:peptidyl-Lys metalloendopeptidase
MENNSRQQGETVSVKYTVTNHESRPVAVLKWNTPLQGLINNPFVVLKDGTERRFVGVMVLRTDPIESDWAVIPANGSLSAAVNLADGYDLSGAGEYQVRARNGFRHVASDNIPKVALKDLRRHQVESNAVNFQMLGEGTPPPTPARNSAGAAAAPSFVQCSAEQQTALNKDFPAMFTEATKVSTAVASWGDCNAWASSPSAMMFLGACSGAGSLSQVARVTATITNRAQGTVVLDCSSTNSCAPGPSACQQANTVAFTCLWGGNNTVYLCGTFFTWPQGKALDSQEGALYHELSHWAGTLDYAYGCKACADLASSNPGQAQNNASNYMYFAAFQATGEKPSCGIEHIAAFGVLLVLTVQFAGRRLMRKKAV